MVNCLYKGQIDYHTNEGIHEYGELDPHTWLSTPLVKKQASTNLTALQDVDPSHREYYQLNYQKFVV